MHCKPNVALGRIRPVPGSNAHGDVLPQRSAPRDLEPIRQSTVRTTVDRQNLIAEAQPCIDCLLVYK